MSVVLFVRHGQASWGAEEYDRLSAEGEEQSRLLGEAFATRGVEATHVFSGGMHRHRQTAAALLAGADWPHGVQVDRGWNEFDHEQMLEVHGAPDGLDDAEGVLTRQQLDSWFDAAMAAWVSHLPGADYDEPFSSFTTRVESAFRRTCSALAPGDTAVVVTSGGPISWVTAMLLGGGVDLWQRLLPVIVNTSVTKVVIGARGATLVSLNEHVHLDPARTTYR